MQVMPPRSSTSSTQPVEAIGAVQKLQEPAALQSQGAVQNRVAEAAPDKLQQQRPADLEAVVAEMNEVIHVFQRSLEFEVVDPNRIVVRVVDTNTGEVIRQVPPERLMDAYSRLHEAIGILLDGKA